MRLTLRTLLAYLDDILEPADAQELGDKIEESDYATGLVHRIRASMGRLRLSSPKTLGKGLGADANTVAEYLDNTLAVERVPEFEKVCLESDMNLAEVASCHQVLTLVLGEPAEVDESLRQRVYALGAPAKSGVDAATAVSHEAAEQSDVSHRVDQAVGQTVAANAAVQPDSSRRDQDVDRGQYDRQGPRILPIALTALLGFVATSILLLMFIGGWNGPNQVVQQPTEDNGPAGITPDWPADSGTTADEPEFLREPGLEPSSSTPPSVAPTTSEDETEDAFSGASSAGGQGASPGEGDSLIANGRSEMADSSAVPAGVDPDREAPAGTSELPGTEPDESRSDRASDAPGPGAVPPTDALATTDASRDTASQPAMRLPGNAAAQPVVAPANPRSNVAGEEAGTDTAPPIEAENIEPRVRDVGRNIIEDQVLAVWNPEEEAWMRMAARAPLEVGLRLRGLPAFRPQLILSNGLQVTLDEGIDLGVMAPAEDGTPRFDISNGRAIFAGVGQEIAQVGIRFGEREIAIRQGDSDSQFALLVQRVMSPGSDPGTAPRHYLVDVWALSGSCAIAEATEPVRDLRAGEKWSTIDARSARIVEAKELPDWATKTRIREIDRSALGELQPRLTTDRSLTLSLLEANQSRRTDLKSLAARCLAALDRFEPVVEAIGDRRQYPHWSRHYQQLQEAVARDARVSERVYETLQRTNGPDADRLYRLLWGFSPQQLQQGAAQQLVDDLTDESLEVRVLAVETLKKITGMHLYYRPEQPLARRQVAIKNWQRRLDSNNIDYEEPPLLFEDGN